ncbi:MAG: phosphodiester glycosidase family protein [Clostridia bacterium]|nr:phosphodiester glycosidase family protein [Clostridia bacterium]
MKKISALLFALTILLSHASAKEIYRYEETIPVSAGITLTKVEEFHSGHNISYSYIEADLTNENIGLTLLKSKRGMDYSETNAALASSEEDVVASLNADFFSHVENKTIALGIEIKDGKMLQSPINPGTMATFSLIDGEVLMSYLDFHIMAVAPNWEYEEIRHLNKHTSYYGDILMFTKEFNGGYSPAPGGEVLEVVVEDGIITEFRRNEGPCPIPENGCVLAVSEGSSMFFSNNFEIGDEIKFDYYISPDIKDADLAFGGGAMLVSEGTALKEFSHNITGYNPRSAIGISEDGETLYLVAVNGRQGMSRGMTMAELSDLMVKLGCYSAVNLDGGGSTSMLASTIWNEKMHVVNSPTETRRVINAIGLTYKDSSEDLPPYKIALESEKNIVFTGESVKILSAVYDENSRAVEGEITWSSDSGKIEDGIFTAEKGGKATITAKSGKATGNTEIFVVDEISGINVPGKLKLSPGESKTLSIEVFDNDGHYTQAENTKPFTFVSDNPEVISVSEGKITAHRNGRATITVKKDNAEAFISVVSGADSEETTYDFEEDESTLITYPSYVGGDYHLSEDRFISGKKSGALSFDFTAETEDSKAVYFSFNTPLTLGNGGGAFSVSVYTEDDFHHEIRALLTDASGNDVRIVLGENLEGGTWHKLKGALPEDAYHPLTLKRIYALYQPEEEKDFGTLYFDDLTFSSSIPYSYPYKSANIYEDSAEKEGDGTKIRVGALSGTKENLITLFSDTEMTKAVKDADYGILLGSGSGFSTSEEENALFITVDTKKGGIRKTSSSQWESLKKVIDESDKNFIFIASDNPVFGSDEFENRVLKDYLASTGKTVTVISKGESDSLSIIGGVRYFTLAPIDNDFDLSSRVEKIHYLEFHLGDSFSYTKKPLID